MDLSRGITGFRHIDDPPLPVTDFAIFRGHCHTAARLLGGRVVSVETRPRGVESNFRQAILQLRPQAVAVLLNTHYPILALAEPGTEKDGTLRFLDVPDVANVFDTFGVYTVAPASDLAAPLSQDACRQLAAAELAQVDYWKPRRVGDLVFNSWD